MKIEIKLL